MKSIIALLLAVPLIWAEDARVCYRGAARVAVDPVDETVIRYDAKGREQTCYSSESGCGAVRKFGISKQWDPETRSFIDDTETLWSTLDLGCVRPGICDAITGDANGACRYASYAYPRYVATSCNASRGYDAEYYLQAVKLYYGCCQGTDKCVDPSRDSAGNTQAELNRTCTENEALGDYIQDLQTCWQVGREVFRRYFECGDGNSIFQYKGACVDTNGEWDRDLAASDRDATACYYRRTCSPVVIGLIKTFSQCACRAAKTNGFSGRAIGAFMESNWNRWCPGIELDCDADNDYAPYVRRRLRRRRIKFRIKRKLADIDTDANRALIREKICAMTRRQCPTDEDEETVTVTATAASDDDTTTRRLVEAADPATQSDIVVDMYGDEGFDDAIATVACSSSDILAALGTELSGGEAYSLSCDSEDAYIDEEGTDPDATTTTAAPESGAFMIGNGFAFIMAIFGYIMQ